MIVAIRRRKDAVKEPLVTLTLLLFVKPIHMCMNEQKKDGLSRYAHT